MRSKILSKPYPDEQSSDEIGNSPSGLSRTLRHSPPTKQDKPWVDYTPIGEGLTVVRSEYHLTRDVVEQVAQGSDGTTLVTTFGIDGESGYIAEKGAALKFSRDRMAVAAFSYCEGKRVIPAGKVVRQLRLVLSPSAVERYLGNETSTHLTKNGKGLNLLQEADISQYCRAFLRPLFGLEQLSPVDRHIAALSLASEILRPLSPPPLPSSRLDCITVQKLGRARDLMHAQLESRLTISYLAMTTGLNEHVLKHGFKYLFGISPARYLLKIRMEKAWSLLAAGARVAQTAYAVGYEHPSNFSNAFTRHFGHPPKIISKSVAR